MGSRGIGGRVVRQLGKGRLHRLLKASLLAGVHAAQPGRERLPQRLHQRHLADHGGGLARPLPVGAAVLLAADVLGQAALDGAGMGVIFAPDLGPAAYQSLPLQQKGAFPVLQRTVGVQHHDARFLAVEVGVGVGPFLEGLLAGHHGGGLIAVLDTIGLPQPGVQPGVGAHLHKGNDLLVSHPVGIAADQVLLHHARVEPDGLAVGLVDHLLGFVLCRGILLGCQGIAVVCHCASSFVLSCGDGLEGYLAEAQAPGIEKRP